MRGPALRIQRAHWACAALQQQPTGCWLAKSTPGGCACRQKLVEDACTNRRPVRRCTRQTLATRPASQPAWCATSTAMCALRRRRRRPARTRRRRCRSRASRGRHVDVTLLLVRLRGSDCMQLPRGLQMHPSHVLSRSPKQAPAHPYHRRQSRAPPGRRGRRARFPEPVHLLGRTNLCSRHPSHTHPAPLASRPPLCKSNNRLTTRRTSNFEFPGGCVFTGASGGLPAAERGLLQRLYRVATTTRLSAGMCPQCRLRWLKCCAATGAVPQLRCSLQVNDAQFWAAV